MTRTFFGGLVALSIPMLFVCGTSFATFNENFNGMATGDLTDTSTFYPFEWYDGPGAYGQMMLTVQNDASGLDGSNYLVVTQNDSHPQWGDGAWEHEVLWNRYADTASPFYGDLTNYYKLEFDANLPDGAQVFMNRQDDPATWALTAGTDFAANTWVHVVLTNTAGASTDAITWDITGGPSDVSGATDIAHMGLDSNNAMTSDFGIYVGDAGVTGAAFDNITIVPEPVSMSLLALGGLALLRRRRR